MRELIVAPQARRDVVAQAAYYRDQGTPETARRWFARIEEAFNFVSANPGSGVEVYPGLRALRVDKFKQHLVVYRTTPDTVEVVRVVHGAADLDAALAPWGDGPGD